MRLENEQYEEIKRVAIDTFSLYGTDVFQLVHLKWLRKWELRLFHILL